MAEEIIVFGRENVGGGVTVVFFLFFYHSLIPGTL